MTMAAVFGGKRLGIATLGLIVALGPALSFAEPAAGPRTAQRVHEVKPGNKLPGADASIKVGQRVVIPGSDTAHRGGASPPGQGAPVRTTASAGSQPPPPRLALAVPDFDSDTPPLGWPAEGPVVSTFGHRRSGWHGGIDIKAPLGTPVQAAAAGVVVTAGVETSYGLVVKIEHKAGFMTVYAHNDVNLVEVGDRVDAGDLIALVGNTGRATTYHVHFEVRRDGLAYNPLYLLPMPPRIAQIDETAKMPHE